MEIEVCGTVADIKKQKGLMVLSTKVEFKILTKDNKYIPMIADMFLPIRKDDEMKCVCHIKNKQAVIVKPPWVTIATHQRHIVHLLMIGLDIDFSAATLFYRFINNQHIGDVFDYITSLAELWHQNHNPNDYQLLTQYGVQYNMTKLFMSWYKEVNLRRLYLFGLNNREIREYHDDATSIYQQCLKNPYVIYTLSLEKCHSIMMRINTTASTDTLICGKIARMVYDFLIKKQWSCVPTTMVLKNYPNAKQYLDTLRDDYHIVADFQSVYIKPLHTIESKVADFVCTMLKSDLIISLNDPLDHYYNAKNNCEFIRYPAVFRDG